MMPCFCFCFPFWGIGSSDLSAEDHYSNEKHFQELGPRQAYNLSPLPLPSFVGYC